MSLVTFLLALFTFLPATNHAPPLPALYPGLKEQAETSYAEKSFRRAHDLYEETLKMPSMPADERRWVEFRLADTAWRSDAASPSTDPTAHDRARAALEELIRQSGADHDRVWAEANESLGDLYTFHPFVRNADSH